MNDLRILAIDSNRDNLTALRAVLLDALPGARLLTALNGPDGIEAAKAEDPDVILLDIVMPGMDGYAVCRHLKEDARLQTIPVLFLTANRTDRDGRIEAMDAGADGFLSKPFDEVELVAQIRAMAKVRAANRRERFEKEELATLVAERTRELEQELADRKRAEGAVRESEANLQKAQAVANVGSWVWRIQSNRLEWSDQMYRIFGMTKDTFTGDLADVVARAIHPDDRPAVERSNLSVINAGKPIPLEYRVIWPNGTVRVVWAEAGELILDAAGNPLVLSGIVHDITERKRAEEEKAKLEVQLRQAQKMEAVGRLAGGVAHDYNNMLGVILGYAELAMGKVAPSDPLHGDLDEIFKSAKRSTEITRQLLAFARKQTIAPKVLDLNETVEGMLKMLRRLIGEDIDLAWLPRAGLWPVRMDPSQLDQILANLCVNARDAIEGVGKVTIETGNVAFDEAYCADHPGFVSGEFVLLAISDNGCGMDTATLSSMFEPFFTTKSVGQGTGLGLATVYGIVKQNSGFINVYSEPGGGTTFKIYVPRHEGDGVENRKESTTIVPSGHGETVLIVEDEVAILKLAAAMLERLGYTVLTAATAGEAMRLAEASLGEIRLLITDVVMPDMNGRELAEQLRVGRPTLKRLFMSGYTANVIAHRGVLDEGVHFIQKPFSLKDLAAKVKAAMDQA